MQFKNWLKINEVGTSTANIAVFARPMMGVVRRNWLGAWGEEDPFFKKKHRGGTSGGVNGNEKEGNKG